MTATVYGVYVNTDLTEGKGPMRLLALFSSEAEAQPAREGWGVMGIISRSRQDTHVRALTVFDTFDEYVDSLAPGSYEEKAVSQYRASRDAEYAEYLRLHAKFTGSQS